MAYSLLGIFDVYMPLIYGEGRENAFTRLRKKIDKSSQRKRETNSTALFTQSNEAASSTIRKSPEDDRAAPDTGLDELEARCQGEPRVELPGTPRPLMIESDHSYSLHSGGTNDWSTLQNSVYASLTDFRQRLTHEEEDIFRFATFEDVQHQIPHIRGILADGKGWELETTQTSLAGLEVSLKAMDQFGKMLEMAQTDPHARSFIWGPLKFVLQEWRFKSDFAALVDVIDAYKQIGEQLTCLLQYQALFGRNPHMQGRLGMVYADVLEILLRTVRIFSLRRVAQMFRACLPQFLSRTKQILEGWGSHRDFMQSHAHSMQIQQYEARLDFLEDLLHQEREKKARATLE
ncbi:hypothetical protein AYO22_00089 [Fonsecaea multimorphosa]|nr:hypothetical protein AYO22_00089 [Fonsecaea multimorphosa]